MGKIYAPLGYDIDYKGKDYYDSSNHEELQDAVLGLADWDNQTRSKILNSSNEQLIETLTDNGFELEEK